ncbi:MarR family winged helix-turn-helix transcriptional regulator [Tenggerimyces flavus]|uniref:MarR family winged helix-turn-helix transcriptional regulator n=1 Tax=Tenggerimyces flavus TaxID=1708749 RepID=A0ABV7YDT2_9ACTN|nr:MarR family transcriptional regulator [Tenggerimyces flavus]MBM7789041.1 DNA-binding MarR family transcriptional regulator [Tenggerimyces flavus]
MTKDDPVKAVEREFAVLFRRSRSMSGTIARQLHPDVGAAAYGLLLQLQQTGGSRLTDLAAFFGIGKPTLSRQVRLLESLGFVERSGDEADRRAVTLRLTEEGLARLTATQEARRERFRRILNTWPREDVDDLGRLLHQFNELQF